MDEQIKKWLNGELSDNELKKFIDAQDLLKYQQILDEVARWTPDNDRLIFDPNEVTKVPKETKSRPIYPWAKLSIAASVVLVISAAIWFLVLGSDEKNYSTGISEVKEITLPDGKSKITLASNSAVFWSEKSWNSGNRKIDMDGKAFLEVEKGSPFEVKTMLGKIEVLGTSFEIEDFGDGLNVTCYEGKVRATIIKNGQSVIVKKGDGFLYFEDEWEEQITREEEAPTWLMNETKFENAPLIQVIKSLEKQFGKKIELSSVNLKRRFTGSFPNQNLKTALKIVFSPFDISYEIKADVVYLKE